MLDTSSEEFKSQKKFLEWFFFLLSVGIGLSGFIQKLVFGLGGENLTKNFRILMFKELMYKHIGWFDNRNRAVGVLTNILAEDI